MLDLNRALNDFADGRATLTLTMSRDGIWLQQGTQQTRLTPAEADKVLIAMRCARVESRTEDALRSAQRE